MAKVNINLQTKGNITSVKVKGKKIGSVKIIANDEFKAFKRNGDQLKTFGHLHDAARALFADWQQEEKSKRVVDTDKLMPVLNNRDLLLTIDNLYYRWQEEKDFEDWNDYSAIIIKKFAEAGAEVIKTQRRPMGATVLIEGMTPIKIFRKTRGNQVFLASAAA